jgi:hypothetical protein
VKKVIMMFRFLPFSFRFLLLVTTLTFGSMAFAVEPSAPVSLSNIFGTTGYGYTLQVTSPTGAAFVHDGKMYVKEGVEYTFKLTCTEADKWYIGIQPTQDDGITLDYDKRNGSQDGAGPNSTYIDITKTFTKAGTHVIAKAFYFQGESFSRLSMTTVDIEVNIIKVDLDSVDANFAPSVEKLDVRYTIKPTGYTASFGKLEVFKNGDTVNPIFKDATITKTGANVLYQWDGKKNQGADSEKYVGPEDSPYTVKVSISEVADFSLSSSVTAPTRVDLSSIDLCINAATVVIMNNPGHQEELSALVKLKKKDGAGEVTAVPIHVSFSFSDPSADNTAKNDSFEYADGQFLGKKNDAAAIHWADHASADSDSTDGYKLGCRGETITDAGPNKGKTYVWFRPSGVGSDDFKLKAVVKDVAGVELMAKESGVMTIWRQITFDKIYEMSGETHVSVNATEAKIQPYFTEAFVDYIAGTAKPIQADKSVQYIGLWKDDARHQESWTAMQTKLPAETPTAEELADAEGPAGGARDVARAKITVKAQAWVDRIELACLLSMYQWSKNGGMTNDSVVGIKYIHPKYNSVVDGEANPDTVTTEWPEWVRVTIKELPDKDPDSFWNSTGNFGGLSHGNGIVSITKGHKDPNLTQCVIAHEVGHATKQDAFFKRAVFGPSSDHSEEEEGLMYKITRVNTVFTDREKKILKGIGIKP